MKRIVALLFLYFIVLAHVIGGVKLEGKSTINSTEHGTMGWAVSVSGEFSVASAPNESYDSYISGGAVYIYKKENGSWTFFQRITPQDPSIMKLFGASVKISESTLIVGAPNDNGKQGAAYVFSFIGNKWVQAQKIIPKNPIPFEMFGTAVDINSGIAIISSVNSSKHEVSSGTMYVYTYSVGKWNEESRIESPAINDNDLFGASLAIVSDIQFVVGAPFGNELKKDCGTLYSFMKTEKGWLNNQQLNSLLPYENGLFGCAISYSDKKLLVGAMQESVDSTQSGAAYIFELDNNQKWKNGIRIIPNEPVIHDYFGMAVSLNKQIAVIGAPKWENAYHKGDMGCADVFVYDGVSWRFSEKIIPDEGNNDDHFAMAIASDNSSLVFGSRFDDNNSTNDGSIYFYDTQDFVSNQLISLPQNFSSLKIIPNPFHNETTITYNLGESGNIKIEIFDLQGKKIVTLVNQKQKTGIHHITWNRKDKMGKALSSGVYICNFIYGTENHSKQIIVL